MIVEKYVDSPIDECNSCPRVFLVIHQCQKLVNRLQANFGLTAIAKGTTTIDTRSVSFSWCPVLVSGPSPPTPLPEGEGGIGLSGCQLHCCQLH